MAAHLHPQENTVQQRGQYRDANCLRRRELSCDACVIWQHQCDAGEQDDHREVGDCALGIEFLVAMASRAGNQAEAHYQIQNDHHYGKNGVPSDGWELTGPKQHGYDQDHFDQDDR